MVAYLWQANFTPQDLEEGKRLYAANCAACHGETGRGDGVYARDASVEMGTTAEAEASIQNDHNESSGTHSKETTDFTAVEHMLGASPALLQGKIVRGGMGTGMPYWGPIFTEEQTWALVAYLWTFQFDLETGP